MRCFFEGCISPAMGDRIAVRLKRRTYPAAFGQWRMSKKLQISERERQRRARQRAMSVDGFCKGYGIGRTKAYEEINAGRLKARKAGTRTIIAEDDAEEWLSLLPAFQEGLNHPSSATCVAAEVRSNESAQSLPPIQKPPPIDPTATADALKQNVSQCARDDEGGRDFEPTLEKKRPIAARRRAVTFQGG
jgi:hypothetical protein